MKPIALDLYKYLYKFSKAKELSYYAAILYVTILNIIVLSGICYLLKAWIPGVALTLFKFFTFPLFVIPATALFYINYKRMPPAILSKEKQIQPTYGKIVVYTLIACVVVGYRVMIKH